VLEMLSDDHRESHLRHGAPQHDEHCRALQQFVILYRAICVDSLTTFCDAACIPVTSNLMAQTTPRAQITRRTATPHRPAAKSYGCRVTALATLMPRVRRASASDFFASRVRKGRANTKILVEKTAVHSHLHSIASLAFNTPNSDANRGGKSAELEWRMS